MTIGRWSTGSKDVAQSEVSTFTVLRLVRLVRITRLVRLLRLKMFHELSLMVNGVIAGLKTLFWAIVFLVALIYSFGVLLRQVLDPDHNDFGCQISVTPAGKVYMP